MASLSTFTPLERRPRTAAGSAVKHTAGDRLSIRRRSEDPFEAISAGEICVAPAEAALRQPGGRSRKRRCSEGADRDGACFEIDRRWLPGDIVTLRLPLPRDG